MMKNRVNSTVKKESLYIALSVVILSMLMEAVFLIIRKWTPAVLFGNLLGGAVAVLNFFLMGLTVQKAVEKDEKDAATFMKFSQTYRLIMQMLVIIIAAFVPVFNVVSAIIPLFFPRLAIMVRPRVKFMGDMEEPASGSSDASAEDTENEGEEESSDE